MKGFGVKSLALVLLVLVVMASNFDSCHARRGNHRRTTGSSMAKGRGKGKGSGGHHHSGGGSGSGKKPSPKERPTPKPCPSPRPKPSPSPSPSPSLPLTPSPNSSPSPTLTPQPSPSPKTSPSPSQSPEPSPSPSPSRSPSPESSPSREPSPSPSPNPSPSPTPSLSPESSPSREPSPSPSPSLSLRPTPNTTPEPSPSREPSPSPSPSLSLRPTPNTTPEPSPSPEPNPSPSPTPSPSPIPSPSPDPSPIPSPSSTLGPTPSPIPEPSPKPSPSPKQSPTPAPGPGPSPTPSNPPGGQTVFNVMDFGAKGNGVSDDTKAFQAAWAAACMEGRSIVLVPPKHDFLVGPISFSGPYCQPNIVFKLDGTIVAPTNANAWGSGLLQWLEFTKLEGITIQGKGVIEGQGAVWWSESQFGYKHMSSSLATKMPHIKPTALRFYGSIDVKVTGITIQNSPQCHLKFDNCVAVEVFNVTVTSPGNSPNTDGIHLQNSRDVSIHHNDLGCGDDCVSIQTGCSNVDIHNITCGPGHGISIGGLGKDNTKACVSNITVQDVTLQGTMMGVRIKTLQGGSGSVRNIRFSNIKVAEVQTPIIIDQYYCDRSACKNQSSAVALAGIAYNGIKGTYTVQPVHLACSDVTPCADISLSNIELEPLQERHHMYDPLCWKAYGELQSSIVPPIQCLQSGKPATIDPDTC